MRPRVLDYDELWQWLEAGMEEADSMAKEYDDQGDDDLAAEYNARREALLDVQRHIEFELAVAR